MAKSRAENLCNFGLRRMRRNALPALYMDSAADKESPDAVILEDRDFADKTGIGAI